MTYYITLPSNTPGNGKNTQSDYTTFLNDSLHLKGDYEVALSEINFGSNFMLNFGSMTFKYKDDNSINITLNVDIPNGCTTVDFFYCLNKLFYLEIKKLDLGLEELKSEQLPFKIILNQTYFKSEKFEIISIEGLLKSVFFLAEDTNMLISRQLTTKLNIINYIIVYTDIIDYQYFGNKKTQILRSIPISYHDDEIQTNFDNQHYVKVKDTHINSINIQLRDIWGNSIRFNDFFSYVIVNLHFRPIQ